MKRLLVAVSVLGLAACGGGDETETSSVQWDLQTRYLATSVQPAFEEARATLPDFLELFENPPEGTERYKVLVRKPSAKPEYKDYLVWISEFERNGAGFVGTLTEDKVKIAKSARDGDAVTFSMDDIYDWTFIGPGGIYGHYALRAETRANVSNPDTISNLMDRFKDISDLPER